MKIVETCNFDSDYPDEIFVNIPGCLSEEEAQKIADIINQACQPHSRYWKVVENDYVLSGGFEP